MKPIRDGAFAAFHGLAPGCYACGHGDYEHMSPAIDLGLPTDSEVCQYGACACEGFSRQRVEPKE